MHSCLQKHVAFNQRILKNEEEISGINSGLANFLQDMQIDIPLFAWINVGERMRGTQPVWGQLWSQEHRQMSATGLPMEGLGKSREEVALSGIVDVLSWRHAFETSQDPNFKRPDLRKPITRCTKTGLFGGNPSDGLQRVRGPSL
jgi:hypothetical protein